MTWKTLDADFIYNFKKSWPCHGLPNDIHTLSCDFASNGDLVDIEFMDSEGNILDSHEFDGGAALALNQDCQEFGK